MDNEYDLLYKDAMRDPYYRQLVREQKLKSDCEKIIEWMLNERCSIRQVAEELCFSKSRVHLLIHTWIRNNDDDSYCQIKTILRFNKLYRCKPRKYWR